VGQLTVRHAIRHTFALRGAEARAYWREVAKKFGRIDAWTTGGRERVRIVFRVNGRDRYLWSDVNRWGEPVPLTRESAVGLLAEIRARVVEVQDLESALAPFLRIDAPENWFGSAWERYVRAKSLEASDGRVTRRHVAELEGLRRRGYLAPLLETSVHAITYGTLDDLLGWLAVEKPGLSPKTRRHVLTSVHACLRWLYRRGELARVPERPQVEVPEHAPVLLSAETVAAILEAIPDEDRGVFLAMALLGLRPGEARGAPATAYRDGWLTVAAAAKDGRAAGEVRGTKTRRVRRLPVPEILAEWIEQHVPAARRLDPREPLFQNARARARPRRYGHGVLKRIWNEACERAHGKGVRFPLYEGTRHSFATNLLASGVPRHVVQKFLGHTSEKTSERYAKLADGALVEVLKSSQKFLKADK
jgi:integrase